MQKRNGADISLEVPEEVYGAKVRTIATGSRWQHVTVKEPSVQLMAGRLVAVQLSSELHLHLADCVETQTAVSHAEVVPGISINIVYEANLRFSLGDHQYVLTHSANEQGGPLLHALVIGQPDMFRRHIEPGNRVRKLNLTISIDWLKARLGAGFNIIERLTRNHAQSRTWPLPQELIEVADSLMSVSDNPGFSEKLVLESEAIKIVSHVLESLHSAYGGYHQPDSVGHYSLLALVDGNLERGANLKEIAKEGRMSVSTLQARFKRTFGITVQRYIRKRLLDRARRQMIGGGSSIGEAAYQAGYNHSSNFITAFRKEFGLTPAQCIEQHRPG